MNRTKEATISSTDRSGTNSETTGLRRQDFLRRAAIAGAAVGAAGGGLVGAAALGQGAEQALNRLDKFGLRKYVNRIDRVIANVTDLERSKEFWENFTSVRAYARTTSPKQAFNNLGISSGQFDGYLMQDPWGGNPCSLHLVQWKTPKPVGMPYKSPFHVGWYRACIADRNTRRWYKKLVAAGVKPWSKPLPFAPAANVPGTITWGFPDPDGLTIEYHEPPGTRLPTFTHMASTTADVDGTRPFYTDVLGLDLFSRFSFCPTPNTLGPDGGEAGFDFTFYHYRSDERFYLDKLIWTPERLVHGTPYDIFRQPTHVGYVRVSLEVSDIDAAYALLRRAGLKRNGKHGVQARISGRPEEWDFGPEFGGRRKVVVFTDPEGVGFELIQEVPYPDYTKPQALIGECSPPGSLALPPHPTRM